ncbi:MAG: GDP-fucose synthetase, partial [Ignavibacteriae bacterium 37-53-5]
EPTNEPYAVAKIAGIKMCQAYNRQYGTHFISVMPTNLYGPNDNFDPENSHVLAALVRKFVEARNAQLRTPNSEPGTVTVWGTGKPRREFLHVDDMADACIFLMQNYDDNEIVNIGTGQDITIRELADFISKEAGYNGTMRFDTSKPDGIPQKLLDVNKIKRLGWNAKVSLREGIRSVIVWYEKFQTLNAAL